MSGGHFDYDQYRIGEIADDIESLIEDNDSTRNFSEKTLVEFNRAVKALRIAEVYAHRVDWLVSCDDGEDTFHQSLAVDLSEI